MAFFEAINGSWLWVALSEAIKQLRVYGRRSLLTSLGIVIAVAGVIAIVGIMQGLENGVRKTLAGLGSETIFIRPNNYKAWGLLQKVKPFTENELSAVSNNISGISNVAMYGLISIDENATLRYQGNVISLGGFEAFSVKASTAYLPDILRRYPLQGRFIAESDTSSRRRVCVISEIVRLSLKLPKNVLGEVIEIAGQPFTVIGLIPTSKRDSLGAAADIYVPFSAGEYLGTLTRPDMVFSVHQPEQREKIIQQIEGILRQSMQTPRTDAEDFIFEDAGEIMKAQTGIINMIATVLLIIVSISLVVGGIGIMNVMLASVTERTHEIGILRAIGASAGHIRAQFLIESGMLAGFGALIGVALGIFLAHFSLLFIETIEDVSVPLWSILLSVFVSIFVGVISGFAPALRAAKISPIEALTHI